MLKALLSVLSVFGWIVERWLTKKDKNAPQAELDAARTDSANENDIGLNDKLDAARDRLRDKNNR